MKLIRTEDAVGQVLCHDITQIIPGVVKDAVFRKGHIVQPEDKVSTVLRANRLIDFVIIRSILPASASATMRLKPSRFLVLVAEMPSSV